MFRLIYMRRTDSGHFVVPLTGPRVVTRNNTHLHNSMHYQQFCLTHGTANAHLFALFSWQNILRRKYWRSYTTLKSKCILNIIIFKFSQIQYIRYSPLLPYGNLRRHQPMYPSRMDRYPIIDQCVFFHFKVRPEMRRMQKVRVRLKCYSTRWRTGGEVKGKLANGVDSQYSSRYLGTWCIEHYYHYYRWCAHLGCQ
jgi:hypothetical protein